MGTIDFNRDNILYISDEQIDIENEIFKTNGNIDFLKIRKKVEPWLTALFQSEHLSLLVGTGLSIALGGNNELMKVLSNENDKNDKDTNEIIEKARQYASEEARNLVRGEPNFEDELRVLLKLLEGLKILNDNKAQEIEKYIAGILKDFISKIIENEKIDNSKLQLLKSFLLSFGSRTATRDRLYIFTTNYDRFIEYGLDESGLLMIDRFVGKLQPIMRYHRIDLDYHYNPPGIRGEPRYVEGVVKFTKLHGSIDWKFDNDKIIKLPLPFGVAKEDWEKHFSDVLNSVVIFPNASKAVETAFFPYSELFRDLSTAICRPNSVLVTYGYGFGDSHINRIISDMLTIPSTHLVIISYDNAQKRIENFTDKCNKSQLTLMVGNQLGDFEKLVTYLLPKPAIDRISERERKILEKREITNRNENLDNINNKED